MNLHVRFTPEQRAAVEQMRRDRLLSPPDRDRVEIALLSDSGWTVAAIATHMSCCLATVRRLIHGIDRIGIDAIQRRRTGPPPDVSRRAMVEAALTARLRGTQRAWSAPQLSAAVREDGIELSTRQISRYLKGMGAGYRRVVGSVRHKQDVSRMAAARDTLDALKKKPTPVA